MAIPLTCGECGKRFKVKDEHAGRKTRCTGCNALIRIPGEKVGAKEKDDDRDEPEPPPFPRAPAPPPAPPPLPDRRARTIEQPRDDFDFGDPVEEEEPIRFGTGKRRRVDPERRREGSWASVGSGFTSVAIGGIVVALNVLVMTLLPKLVDESERTNGLNWMMGVVLMTLVGFVLGLFGRLRSWNAPDREIAGLAGISSILAMVATGLWAVVVLLIVLIRVKIDNLTGGNPDAASGIVTLLQLITYIAPPAIIVALVGEAFHARLAAKLNGRFRRDGLSVFATVLFIVFLVLAVLYAILTLIDLLGEKSGRGASPGGSTQTIGTIQQIVWIASTVAYVVLLFLSAGGLKDGPPPPRRRDRERERDRDEDDHDDRRARNRNRDREDSRRPRRRDDDDD